MARKEIAVKKYVVTLSNQEREHLTALIHSGHHPAQKLLKARILLKADASDGGGDWSDSQIAAALETSVDTVARTRQRLVEEGFEATLIRKHSPNSARRRIFDGAVEARLSLCPYWTSRPLALDEDALDQRQIIADLGAPPPSCDPGGIRQSSADLVQR